MSKRYQGGILGVGFNPLRAPNAPTIGTATAGNTTATVPFTAPACVGGSAITGYTGRSTPGDVAATASASPLTFSGLTNCTAYTFGVFALNSYGPSPVSAFSNSVTPAVTCATYTTAGTYSWVVPAGVTSASVVAVGGGGSGASNACGYGGGGGGGGGLGYKNAVSLTPGETITIVVGAGGTSVTSSNPGNAGSPSQFKRGATIIAAGNGGGAGIFSLTQNTAAGGSYTGDGGGSGGSSTSGYCGTGWAAGGAGAGGYAGNGGNGGNPLTAGAATAGSGGGGGGGGYQAGGTAAGGGGGVGILGQGTNGAAAASGSLGGGGGSNGTVGSNAVSGAGAAGGLYGGGGGGAFGIGGPYASGAGAGGAVRIIWPGTSRSFPSTNTGNL